MDTFIYIACGVLGVVARVLAASIGGKRDLANRRFEFRVNGLVEAWRTLERSASEPVGGAWTERALAEIRLFAAPRLADMARAAAESLAKGEAADLTELREALLSELRGEMNLGRTGQRVNPASRLALSNVFGAEASVRRGREILQTPSTPIADTKKDHATPRRLSGTQDAARLQ